MNNKIKNEVKKNVATSVSTTAGATAGVMIGTVLSPEEAHAGEISTSEPTLQPNPSPKPASQSNPVKPEPITPAPTKPDTQTPQPESEIEVVGYDRVTNEDGNQMDIAVLNVNGNEVGVIDANLDGEADALVCDINQNGVIEEGEIEIIQNQGIAMQPFQDAAGFNPQYAQNNLPDYVNDADVDTYMA